MSQLRELPGTTFEDIFLLSEGPKPEPAETTEPAEPLDWFHDETLEAVNLL